MKFGLIIIAALILSALGAHFVLQDPGYVVINFRGYIVEMSVPVLFALFISTLIGLWLVAKVMRAPRKLGEAAARYRSGRAGQRLTRGMIEVAEGNFLKGEKMLARTAHKSDAPLLNYLQAARAAHLLGQHDRRDGWLRQAYEQTPEAANAILLTQAELQLDQGQHEQALATLRRLTDGAPNHSRALALLGRVYYQLDDWQHLGELLPQLRKHGRMDAQTLDEWALRVHSEALAKAADSTTVEMAWQTVPRNERRKSELREAYYANLIRTDAHDKAEKEIGADLKKEWRGSLVKLYGMAAASDPSKQLKRAENWLRTHGEDADLLLAAARLCLKTELWGKARSYLETVIALRPTPEAYQEYGRLLNQLGDSAAAADAFRDGLNIVTDSAPPDVPLLSSDADDIPKLESDAK